LNACGGHLSDRERAGNGRMELATNERPIQKTSGGLSNSQRFSHFGVPTLLGTVDLLPFGCTRGSGSGKCAGWVLVSGKGTYNGDPGHCRKNIRLVRKNGWKALEVRYTSLNVSGRSPSVVGEVPTSIPAAALSPDMACRSVAIGSVRFTNGDLRYCRGREVHHCGMNWHMVGLQEAVDNAEHRCCGAEPSVGRRLAIIAESRDSSAKPSFIP